MQRRGFLGALIAFVCAPFAKAAKAQESWVVDFNGNELHPAKTPGGGRVFRPAALHGGPYSTNPAWDGKVRYGREFNTITLDGVDKSDLKITCLKTGPKGWIETFETRPGSSVPVAEWRENYPNGYSTGFIDYNRKRIYGNVEYTPTLEAVPEEGEFDLENYPGYPVAVMRSKGVASKDVRQTLVKQRNETLKRAGLS